MIDICLTNIRHIAKSGTVLWNASDHLPIFIIKKKLNPHVEKTTFLGRSYIKLTSDEFKAEMSNFPADLILREQDPAKAWDIYFAHITELLNKYCPEKIFVTKSFRAPYVTNELIQLSKNREKLFKKAHKSKIEHDWNQAVQSRSEANVAIRRSRRHYILNEIKSAKGNPIKFWNTMKKLIPNTKCDTIKSVFDEDNQTILHGKKAANRINSYFCNVSTVLDAKLAPATETIPDTSSKATIKLTNCEYITRDNLVKELKNIDVAKASGFLGISTKFLKTIFMCTPDCLLHIMNRCIAVPTFPDSWKVSITSAIPKKGDHQHISNIRPISILPLPGKLLERFVNTSLIDHFEHNKLLCNEQGGFRKNHSTAQSCFDILHSVYTMNNLNSPTIITYI